MHLQRLWRHCLAQHFLLSAQARTLSLVQVMRMTDVQAFNTFKAIRWADNGGEPVCPKCGGLKIYELNDNRRFKCAASKCRHKFSVTSGTIFASHKMSLRDLLAAIAIFVNGAKGYAALHLSRDLNCQYKTAFVLSHKLREALAAEVQGQVMKGSVEVDGALFGGYVKPKNVKKTRDDRRIVQSGKRQTVMVVRERKGRATAFIAQVEAEGAKRIPAHIAKGSTVYADDAPHWDDLHGYFLTKRINHGERYADGIISTNWAESFFSRLRRAEVGTHHHIAGRYLEAYALEMAWRENHRRTSNRAQYEATIDLTMKHPVSKQWKGYWQRQKAA